MRATHRGDISLSVPYFKPLLWQCPIIFGIWKLNVNFSYFFPCSMPSLFLSALFCLWTTLSFESKVKPHEPFFHSWLRSWKTGEICQPLKVSHLKDCDFWTVTKNKCGSFKATWQTQFPFTSGNVKGLTSNNLNCTSQNLSSYQSVCVCVFLPPLVAWTPEHKGWPVFHAESQPTTLPKEMCLCMCVMSGCIVVSFWVFVLYIHVLLNFCCSAFIHLVVWIS